MTTDTDRNTTERFSLVRCSLLLLALDLTVSEISLNLQSKEPKLLLTRARSSLELLSAIRAFVFELSFAGSAFAHPQKHGDH